MAGLDATDVVVDAAIDVNVAVAVDVAVAAVAVLDLRADMVMQNFCELCARTKRKASASPQLRHPRSRYRDSIGEGSRLCGLSDRAPRSRPILGPKRPRHSSAMSSDKQISSDDISLVMNDKNRYYKQS